MFLGVALFVMSGVANAQVKIAHVNTAEILDAMPEKAKAEKAKQTKKKNSVTGKVANSALNAVGREVGRSFTRGLLGVLKKWF